MPMKWIEPEEFFSFKHNGKQVAIYHCYKNECFEDRLHYHFTTSRDEDERYSFDVRDLGSMTCQAGDNGFDSEAKLLIRSAISKGTVKLPE